MKNKTMQEMNEKFKNFPVQQNVYEVDGRIYHVTSHFVGNKNINDVILKYAENRAIGEMLGRVPTAEKK
ncbi:MAG: hypothetical protein NC489_30465 [Ruminococcus flavefaciens]|nr:hypothetical protein [Ruminococcus flavefaciens]